MAYEFKVIKVAVSSTPVDVFVLHHLAEEV